MTKKANIVPLELPIVDKWIFARAPDADYVLAFLHTDEEDKTMAVAMSVSTVYGIIESLERLVGDKE